MTLFKILVSCILFVVMGKSIELLNDSSSNDPKTNYQLPKSNLRLETSVKYLSPSFRSKNQVNYSYELNVFNNYDLDYEIRTIEVFDTHTPENPIVKFDKSYLSKNLIFPGRDGHKLKANGFAIIHITFPLNESSDIPKEVFHRIHYTHTKANGDIIHPVVDVAQLKLSPVTNINIGLPVRHGKWLYSTNRHKYQRVVSNGQAIYPERFGIDWIKINEKGRYVTGDIFSNENWCSYNEEVLAVASGRVLAIRRDIKENQPFNTGHNSGMTSHSTYGNSIEIDIGNGIKAVYGHLQPIDKNIKVGDQLVKGQVIGFIGNSGESDYPHLHFHIETIEPSHSKGEGHSFHFESYTQLEQFSDQVMEHIWENLSGELPMDQLTQSQRYNEWPAGNGVIYINQ